MGDEKGLLTLYDQCLATMVTMDDYSKNTELELIESFEATRRKWLHSELELKKYKELLVKSDVEKSSLEVKLKHARNQVDVEMRRRLKAEGEYQYLQRQMQLMCDILVHDSKSSACLNDEQKSLIATFNHKGASISQYKSNKRLTVIDESSFLSHSDISYDRTDDDLDLDTTILKPRKPRVREKRRSSLGTNVGAVGGRRGRMASGSAEPQEGKAVDKEVQTTMKASVAAPESRGQLHVVHFSPETQANAQRTQIHDNFGFDGDDTSLWMPNEALMELNTPTEMEMTTEVKISPHLGSTAEKPRRHDFQSKTVIRPEKCMPCGKRIRFGKMVLKCKACRVTTHPECKQKCLEGCGPSSSPGAAQRHTSQDTLESFAPLTHPRIPLLIVQCVREIERRGLKERGIYRVPGGDRLVKELREKYVQRKEPLMLDKVAEVHVVCGLLKDFLRKLKEPLVTFKLHKTFLEATEIPDEGTSAAVMYRAIGELPQANRDTLAFLMLHLQKVMQSPICQMDQLNLARVFGPTVVGYGMADPSPLAIVTDTNTQPKVICRMLSFPAEYWKCLITTSREKVSSTITPANMNTHRSHPDPLFAPVTSPELREYYRNISEGPEGRTPGHHTIKAKPDPGKRFFTSPTASALPSSSTAVADLGDRFFNTPP